MPKDPFDFKDTSDLPSDLAGSLVQRTGTKGKSRYLDLVRKANRPVSVAEVRAAHYREYGNAPSAGAVTRSLASLVNRGALVRVSHGIYAMPKTK